MITTRAISVKKDNKLDLLNDLKTQGDILRDDIVLPFLKKGEKKKLELLQNFNIKKLELLSLENSENENKIKKLEESYENDKKELDNRIVFLNSLELQFIKTIYYDIIATGFTCNHVLFSINSETYKIPITYKKLQM